MTGAAYQAPTFDELKSHFGEDLTEIKVEERASDVDDFVQKLENALQATKDHSIQFG